MTAETSKVKQVLFATEIFPKHLEGPCRRTYTGHGATNHPMSLSSTDQDPAPLIPEVGVMALVPDAWDSPWQTRHYLLSWLARYFHVVWIEPAHEWRKMLKPGRAPVGQISASREPQGLQVYPPEFWLPKIYRPASLARRFMRLRVRRARRSLLRRGCKKFVVYIWRPEFDEALLSGCFDRSCYHIDDEYSFSQADMPIDDREARLIASVDQVFIHSRELYRKKGSINPHTVYVPNGVAYHAYADEAPEPPDLAAVPHPRVGYTGYLKKTLDWGLCLYLAKNHPEWSIVFVGPVAPNPEVLKALQDLSSHRNVYFLGAKSPQALASYAQHFDVCIMPYRTDTHSMKYGYPLKLHEYLASGRPSVGTPLVSLQEFAEVVSLASTPEQWSAAITGALSPEANSLEARATRQNVAQRHDWETLVLRIATAIAQSLGQEFSDRLASLPGVARV
jgi:hypothetical protein